jgi:hypothetical protein
MGAKSGDLDGHLTFVLHSTDQDTVTLDHLSKHSCRFQSITTINWEFLFKTETVDSLVSL